VAGVILITTGAVYAFIGLKNKWLHTYLSSAYLASLAVTVLILYVMNPPVSNAIQGAYFVAITMTGLVLGGAALVFKEMTEGLGCLFGGFCLAMWLLVLSPGGLLTSTGSISIFITSFTVVIYATSFNHYTRPYSLIGSIPFGGATVVVLGIDCFSKAGLKEFWAYIWNLNTNLFPLGATTYPLTRGIRVEIVATIAIFLAGIISQLRLWKIIQSRREQRAAERLDAERNLREEESNLGQRVKRANARDRGEWEAVYGDKDVTVPSMDSGSGSVCSPKNRHGSIVTSLPHSSDEQIEMEEISSPPTMTGAGLVMGNRGQDGGVIVRVIAEDIPTIQLGDDGHPIQIDEIPENDTTARNSTRKSHATDEGIWIVGSDGEARPSRHNSKRSSKQTSGAPGIIPLPFTVPNDEGEDDRSSVATFADDDSKRLAKQISQASLLLRNLSKRSQRNSQVMSRPTSVSTEKLVVPHEDDDRASIAATVDDMTEDEGTQNLLGESPLQSPMVEKYDETEHKEHSSPQLSPTRSEFVTVDQRSLTPLQQNHVATTPIEVPNTQATETRVNPGPQKTNGDSEPKEGFMEQSSTGTKGDESLRSSTDSKSKSLEAASASAQKPGQEAEITEKRNTATLTPELQNASLIKDSLPSAVSKVVASYRTNEWAKHLSSAEAPEIEVLRISDYLVESGSKVDEVPAPVHVEELQQTASGPGDPAPVRSVSQASKYSKTQRASKNNSYISLALTPGIQYPSTLENHSQPDLQQSLNSLSASQYNMRSLRNSSAPVIGETLVESPTEDEFPSQALAQSQVTSSPARLTPPPFVQTTSTTLLGRRDALLRSRPSFGHTSFTPIHDTTSSRVPSETNSPTYDPRLDDDNLSLSARRKVLRQSSLQIAPPVPTSTPLVSLPHLLQKPIPPTTTLPHRKSLTLTPEAREAQLASWRASVQAELYAPSVPKQTIERHRSALLQGRSQAELERIVEMQKRGIMDNVFNERMRSGGMLEAHREALKRMQQQANKHV
jgi:hypothetical protein